jgi:hypothetical protein
MFFFVEQHTPYVFDRARLLLTSRTGSPIQGGFDPNKSIHSGVKFRHLGLASNLLVGSDDPRIRGGVRASGVPGVAEKNAFLDAQEAEMPSTEVRLTAGRHEKGKKNGVPRREGIFFPRIRFGPPGVGVAGGGSGPHSGSGGRQIPRENWTPALSSYTFES